MQAFKDTAGRTWEITINVATVRRVRGSCLKLDLMKLVDDGAKGLTDLLNDIVAFVDLLYVLCQPQADQLGVTDIQFGESMGGDSLDQAADAFMKEFIDFFPQKKARENLHQLMSKSKSVSQILMDRGASEVANLDPESIAEKLMSSLTTRQALSASTPDRLHLDNSAA
jgi:hypothetical protein